MRHTVCVSGEKRWSPPSFTTSVRYKLVKFVRWKETVYIIDMCWRQRQASELSCCYCCCCRCCFSVDTKLWVCAARSKETEKSHAMNSASNVAGNDFMRELTPCSTTPKAHGEHNKQTNYRFILVTCRLLSLKTLALSLENVFILSTLIASNTVNPRQHEHSRRQTTDGPPIHPLCDCTAVCVCESFMRRFTVLHGMGPSDRVCDHFAYFIFLWFPFIFLKRKNSTFQILSPFCLNQHFMQNSAFFLCVCAIGLFLCSFTRFSLLVTISCFIFFKCIQQYLQSFGFLARHF